MMMEPNFNTGRSLRRLRNGCGRCRPLHLAAIALCVGAMLFVSVAATTTYDTPLTVKTFTPPATIASDLAAVVPSTPPVVLPRAAGGDVFVAYYNYLSVPVRSAIARYGTTTPSTPGQEVLLAEGSIVSSMASLAPPQPARMPPWGASRPTTTTLSPSTSHYDEVVAAVTQLTMDAPSGSFLAGINGAAQPSLQWVVDRRNATSSKSVLVVPEVALTVFLRPLVSMAAAASIAQELVAVNTTTGALMWTRTFDFPAVTDQPSVTYYVGYLYFFTGDTLNRLHATTGTSMGAFNSPCNVSSTQDSMISWALSVATFAFEVNGNPLDAFVVYGNTSRDLFTLCRFSHNTGLTEWVQSVVFPLNLLVDDITGGAGNLFLTGHAINASAPPGSAWSIHYYSFAVNASNGHLVDFPYVRSAVDARSYPRLLPPVVNDNCVGDALGNSMMVQQIGGRTIAYCAAVPYLLQWISEVPCYHTPLMVTPPISVPLAPLYGVACAAKVDTPTPSIAMLHADSGDVLWSASYNVGAPMATDHLYVYAVDPHGVLAQFSVAPTSSVPRPGGVQGLTSGETALVVILVLAAVGGGGFAVMRSRCGGAARRRVVAAGGRAQGTAEAGAGEGGSSVALNRQEYGTVVQ